MIQTNHNELVHFLSISILNLWSAERGIDPALPQVGWHTLAIEAFPIKPSLLTTL